MEELTMGDNINELGTVKIGDYCRLITQPHLATVTSIKKKFLRQLPQLKFEDGLGNIKILGIVESYKIVAKDSAYGLVWVHANDFKAFLCAKFIESGDKWPDATTHATGIINGITQLFAD
jgi:hypothetical protein